MIRTRAPRALLLGLLAAAISGCGTGDSPTTGVVVRDSAGVRILENHTPIWSSGAGWTVDPIPTAVIGAADGDRHDLLDEVSGAVRMSDGRILIVDGGTAELRFYDGDGRFVAAAGGRGGGPGEFGRIPFQLLRTSGDTLVLLDMPSAAVVRFDDQGIFIDRRQIDREPLTAALPPGSYSEGLSLLPGGGFIAPAREIPPIPEPTGHRRPGGYIVVAEGGGTAFLEPFPSNDFSSLAFGRSSLYAIGGERLAIGDNASYEIFVFTPAGELKHRIRNMRPSQPVTSEDLAAVRSRLIERAQNPEQASEWARAFDTADHARTFPAFSSLFIDRMAHLWVRRPLPVRVDADTPAVWDIYDGDGVLLGEIALPVRLRLQDIGEDYLLGVIPDDFGVQRVQLHRLDRGGAAVRPPTS